MGITDQMMFEQARDKIEALLVANQGSLFRTIVGQKQRVDADEVKNGLRTIQIFYEAGEYDDRSSGKQTKEHACEFKLEYKLAKAAEADLTILDSETATPAQKAAALLAADTGARRADIAMDEFRRIISQILLDPANRGLGFDITPSARGKIVYPVSRLKLENFRKNQPFQKGSLVVLTASETFKFIATETFDGASVTEGADSPVNYGTELTNADGDPDTDPSLFDVDS